MSRSCDFCNQCETIWQSIIGENTVDVLDIIEDDPITISENELITDNSVASAVFYQNPIQINQSLSLTSIHTSDPHLNELSPNPITHYHYHQLLEDFPPDFE